LTNINIHYRLFNGIDEVQIIPLWNQCLIRDPITLEKFRQKILLDENFDPQGCIVVELGKKIIGFSLSIRRRYPYYGLGFEKGIGWITIMFVHPEYQRKGIGQELIIRSETFLSKSGTNEVLVSPYTPNYFLPGIDIDVYSNAYHLFMKSGYKKHEKVYSMGRSLLDFHTTPELTQRCKDLKKQGITIKTFESKYTVNLLEFLRLNYPGDLFRIALERLRFYPESDNIFIALKHDDLIGFSHFNGDHFGPFGIAPEYSGRGIGTCLYYQTALHMKEKGERNLWLAWTSGHSKDFYYKMDLKVLRRHEILKKNI
jgi:GNAT superfamily N-acetyltransferase